MLEFGELTEEEAKHFKEEVNKSAKKKYSVEEMEIWPDDATDEEVQEIIDGRFKDE
ncbi:MAG: hypothetical protein J6I76_06190 [Oribacterium sp.]|nr:hypothetical protein [Oribacterium sp.]